MKFHRAVRTTVQARVHRAVQARVHRAVQPKVLHKKGEGYVLCTRVNIITIIMYGVYVPISIYVHDNCFGLTGRDKVALRKNGKLCDRHMNAANKLLAVQFPHLQGLQSTLLSQTSFTSIQESGGYMSEGKVLVICTQQLWQPMLEILSIFVFINIVIIMLLMTNSVLCLIAAVQILHVIVVERDHWVATSYSGGVVNLYDSVYTGRLTPSLEKQMAEIYSPVVKDGMLPVTMVPFQQQVGGTDCGVFSIAAAYSAALGIEPPLVTFDADEIRRHLERCFENEKLTPFPPIFP